MRKNNDGYVIIYVVFVVLFLCIVAVGTCTVAVSNLKTQASYTEQLQDKYEAEGAIEKFMAEVCTAGSVSATEAARNDAMAEAKKQFVNKAQGLATADDDNKIIILEVNEKLAEWEDDGITGDNIYVCRMKLRSGAENINAGVEFKVKITTVENTEEEYDEETGETETVTVSYTVSIDAETSKYLSYSINGSGGEP